MTEEGNTERVISKKHVTGKGTTSRVQRNVEVDRQGDVQEAPCTHSEMDLQLHLKCSPREVLTGAGSHVVKQTRMIWSGRRRPHPQKGKSVARKNVLLKGGGSSLRQDAC